MKNQADKQTSKRPKRSPHDFGVTGANPEIVERIKQAVKKGGGNKVVSEKSGIPIRTLGNYLGGLTEPKASAIGALCRVCGVSLQWLIYGEGPEESLHFKDWRTDEAHPLGQIAKLIYEAIYEAGKTSISPATFDALMVELYNLHLQDIPEDDPRWKQFKRLMKISLQGNE